MELPSELMCPITRDFIETPAIAADGFTYDSKAIKKWFKKHDISPMLGSQLNSSAVVENRAVKFFAAAFKKLKSRTAKYLAAEEYKRVKDVALDKSAKEKFDKAVDEYYMASAELKDCCARIKEVYVIAPMNFEVVLNRANMLRFAADYDDALQLFKELKELRPHDLTWKYLKIKTLLEMRNAEKATQSLEKTLSRHRIADHTLKEISYLSFTQSKVNANLKTTSENFIRAYLQLVPKDPRALSHLISIELQNENYEGVVTMATQCVREGVRDISVLVHLAKAYSELKDAEHAKSTYLQIVAATQDFTVKARALYSLAQLRSLATELEQVVKEMEESYRLDPEEDADVYLTLLYLHKHRYREAEEWLSRCAQRVDINSSPTLLLSRAQIEENKKELKKAVESYIRLAEIDAMNVDYYNLKIGTILDLIKSEVSS